MNIQQSITKKNSTVLVNSKIDSNEERGCETEKTVDRFNSLTKKVGHSQMEGIGEIDMSP